VFGKLDGVKRALTLSIAMHVAIGAALIGVRVNRPISDAPSPITIDVVDAPKQVEPVAGGGASFVAVRTAAPTPAPKKHGGRAKEHVAAKPADDGVQAVSWSGSSEHASAGGVGLDGDGGNGRGIGGNIGDGIGLGDGVRTALTDNAIVLPAAPKESKARPAKLIYPKRESSLGEDKLFIARITVDTDGFVVGARLVRGHNGPGDDEAADLIFRFRYLPALDDDGRAIASTFEQPFHVAR
jgi:hypothetical protein